jgi:phytanoyl-CoA hydroxylase
VIAWIALDDITVANGAMKVIPGSHRRGFLPWYKVPGETHHTRVRPEFVEEDKAVHAEVKAGSALVFHQLLLHSSDQISSGAPRRAFRASYQGCDQILAPRGIPLVVRGGSPESFAARFPNRPSEVAPQKKKPLFRRAINRLGRVLADF